MRSLLLTLALGVALISGPVAYAETYRVPQTSNPAWVIDVPAGWSASYDDNGNLLVIADDHSAGLQLSILSDPSVNTTPLSELAAEIISSADASPYTSTAPGSLDGIPGETFIGVMPIQGGGTETMRLTMVKLDATHSAVQVELTRPDITKAQRAALYALAASTTIVGR